LLADGLAVGEGDAGQRGGTTEWDLEPVPEEPIALDEIEEPELADAADIDGPSLAEELDGIAREVSDLDRRISPEPSPEPEEETVIARARQIFGDQAEPATRQLEVVPAASEAPAATSEPEPPREGEGTAGSSPVLRLIEQTRAERRAHHDRVAGLFPRPETTEWDIREIAYDRRRRAEVSELT
jgi:hypothetical protein